MNSNSRNINKIGSITLVTQNSTPPLISPVLSIPKQEFYPFSNFNHFKQTNQTLIKFPNSKDPSNPPLLPISKREPTSIQNTLISLTKSKPKDINYFREILSFSKHIPKRYKNDKFLLKIHNNVKSITEDPKYNESITLTASNFNGIKKARQNEDNILNDKMSKTSMNGMNIEIFDNYYNRIESDKKRSLAFSVNNSTHYHTLSFRTDSNIISNNFINVIDCNKKPSNNSLNSNLSPVDNITQTISYRLNKAAKVNLVNNLLYKAGKSPTLTDSNKKKTSYPKIFDINGNLNSFSGPTKHHKKIISDENFYIKDACNNIIQPISFNKVNKTLTNEIKDLIQNSTTLNKKKSTSQQNHIIPNDLTNYANDLLNKIKVIQKFISKQPPKHFIPNQQRHKIVYVIVDGTVILSQQHIKGVYVEIPTVRYLSMLNTKRERLEKFYDFLSQCKEKFKSQIPFSNIFLLNGIPIFDLIDIPETDNCVYISKTMVFKGIHLFTEHKIKDLINNNEKMIEEKDARLLTFEPASKDKKTKFDLAAFLKKRKKKRQNEMENRLKHFRKITKQKKYLNEQSFTAGYTDKNTSEEEYKYFSDDNRKRIKVSNYLSLICPSKLNTIAYMHKIQLDKKINLLIEEKNKIIKNKYASRPNENTIKGLYKLVKIYNNIRAKKYNITIHQHKRPHKNRTVEQEVHENATTMMKFFIQKMKIFRTNQHKNIEINTDALTCFNKIPPNKKYINKNIWSTHNFISYSDFKIEKFYPDLISFNIPHFLNAFPKLKRRELFEIFIEFKTLLKICVSINKNLRVIKEGIDFNTFFNSIPKIKLQKKEMAIKIFNAINVLNSKYLNWEEFMNGMLTLKSKDLNDKMDLFLKIIDEEGNGYLSFDEVYGIAISSLSRQMETKNKKKHDENNLLHILADYFARLVFQLVGKEINEQLSFEEIRSKISEGGKVAEYFQMLICADNFM